MGERGPQPGEGGRPPKEIDVQVAKRAASLGCTVDETAALLGIGRQTFFDHLARDQELKEALEEGRAMGRATLRRLQWKLANEGNATMLVWLGKQLLGQRDRHEIEQTGVQTLTMQHLTAARTPMTITGDVVAEPEPAPAEPRNLFAPALE